MTEMENINPESSPSSLPMGQPQEQARKLRPRRRQRVIYQKILVKGAR